MRRGAGEDVSLRPAGWDDAAFLYELANDLACRENSLNPGAIAWEGHLKWLESVLASPDRKLYILLEGAAPIGQGRLEAAGGTCMVSYSIIPERRGAGYGKRLVQLLNNAAVEDFPHCLYTCGKVVKSNAASQKIFEELGYSMEEREDCFYYRRRAEYSTPGLMEKEHPGGVMLLSNNRNSFPLYQRLKEMGERICFHSGKLTEGQVSFLRPRLVVSYNYMHIIPGAVIRQVKGQILNLHISCLPWNRGSDPNLWSFVDNTPKGVTIHKLSEKLDQGDVLLQKELFFDERTETFRSSYEKLNWEAAALFLEHFQELKKGSIRPRPQEGGGSFHRRKDREVLMGGEEMDWDETIYDFKKRRGLA